MMLFRKNRKHQTVVLCSDLPKLMLEDRIMIVPNYRERDERELIVLPRSIYGQKVKKKKTIKL